MSSTPWPTNERQSTTPTSGNKLPPTHDLVATLINSPNQIAAGVGEIVQAMLAGVAGPSAKPIMIECGPRVMALGRGRMATMTGRNAFLYLKSKFGLLNATTAIYLQASFIGAEEEFIEVDMDAWEELVPHMQRVRLLT